MKRSLSFILALCMVIAMLPTTLFASAFDGEAFELSIKAASVHEDAVTGTAPANNGMEYPYSIKSITEFGMTDGVWKYFASSGLSDRYGGMAAALTELHFASSGSYLALKVNVPATGAYDVAVTTTQGTASFYLLPGDTAADGIESALNGTSKKIIKENSPAGTATKNGISLEEGEVILVVKAEAASTVRITTARFTPGEAAPEFGDDSEPRNFEYKITASAVHENPETGNAPAKNGMEYSYSIKTVTEYGMTDGLWKYIASSGLSDRAGGMAAALTQLNFGSAGGYLAIKGTVPATGRYDFTYTTARASAQADYYLLPGDTDEGQVLTATEGKISLLEAYSTSAGTTKSVSGIDLAQGEYILVIKANGGDVVPVSFKFTPNAGATPGPGPGTGGDGGGTTPPTPTPDPEPEPEETLTPANVKYTYDFSANKSADEGDFILIEDGESAAEVFPASDTDGWAAYAYSQQAEYIQVDTQENKTLYQKVGDYLQLSMQGDMPTKANNFSKAHADSWVAFETGELKKGTYTAHLDYKTLQGAGAADIYVLPYPEEELTTDEARRAYVAGLLSDGNTKKAGDLNCEQAGVFTINENTKQTEFELKCYEEDSKFLIVFKRTSASPRKKLFLKRLILDGVGDEESRLDKFIYSLNKAPHGLASDIRFLDLKFSHTLNTIEGYAMKGNNTITVKGWLEGIMEGVGSWFAAKIKLQSAGDFYLQVNYLTSLNEYGGKGSIYILPGDTAAGDIDAALEQAEPVISGIEYFKPQGQTFWYDTDPALVEGLERGEHLLVFTLDEKGPAGGTRMYPTTMTFTRKTEDKPHQIVAEKLLLEDGETTTFSFKDEEGNPVSDYEIVGEVTSSDDEIVSARGDVLTAGEKFGNAELSATLRIDGEDFEAKGYVRHVDATIYSEKHELNLNSKLNWRNPAWYRDPYRYIASNDEQGTMYGTLDIAGELLEDGIPKDNTDGSWGWYALSAANKTGTSSGVSVGAEYLGLTINPGEWGAIETTFKTPGKYRIQLDQYSWASGTSADVYVIPKPSAPEEVAALLRDEYKVGSVDQYNSAYSSWTLAGALNSVYLGDAYIDEAGDYIIVIKRTGTSGTYVFLRKLLFTSQAPMASVGGSTTAGLAIGEEINIDKSCITWDSQIQEFIDATTMSYESLTPEIVSVTSDGNIGTVTALANGYGRIKVTATYGEYSVDGEYIVIVGTAKTRRSYYTEEKVANARENIQKYDWAKQEVKSVIATADRYLDKFGDEGLYDFITTNGLPRAIVMAYDQNNDSGSYDCAYCGAYLYTDYGSYPWRVDIFNDPWKIRCRVCARRFPSNDFGSFYKLGFDEHGNWSSELARAENQRLIDSGFFANQSEERQKYGYLANDLYPEKGSGWGVDDGWGFVYEYTNSAGIVETRCEPYIAYYNGWEMWEQHIRTAMESLSLAYVYTGDIKYGRAAAIMIDRLADVFPDMYVKDGSSRFHLGDGGTNYGKIVGALHDYAGGMKFMAAYDAVWPAYEDPTVIEFLSKKAEEWDLPNKKRSATEIRANIENNFVRRTFEEVKAANIEANFGTHQKLLILTAIVLDTMPESRQIIDFVFQTSHETSMHVGKVTGGNVYYTIMSELNRDGGGNEAAALYNTGFAASILEIADFLTGYRDRLPEGYDLYKLPKIRKSLMSEIDLIVASSTNPNFGDNRNMGEHVIATTFEILMSAFRELEDDPEYRANIARTIYIQKKGNLDGIHEDIWTKNPEAIRDEIEEAMGGTKEIKIPSKDLTGYGIAILRDGEWYNSLSTSDNVNTQRDFYIWYGTTENHGQWDKLTLGGHAFGLDVLADIGTPKLKSFEDAHQREVAKATLAHNTVQVDGFNQRFRRTDDYGTYLESAFPHHFDSTDRVQLMDIEQPESYDWIGVEDYRRTVVSVDINDDISYAVDFFKVVGGDKQHIYSFHALGREAELTLDNGVGIVKQVDENGNYIGSYQGIDKDWGTSVYDSIALSNEAIWATRQGVVYNDPGFEDNIGKIFNVYDLTPLQYERWHGLTGRQNDGLGTESWFGKIDRAANPENVGVFSVDWDILDYKKVLKPANDDIGVKLTMVNSFKLDEIATTSLIPPQVSGALPDVRFLLAKHTGENDGKAADEKLKSLFTAVIEPYDGESLVEEITPVTVTRKDGAEFEMDEAKAVRVKLKNGREDYIIYSQNNTTGYTVHLAEALADGAESFDFEGFVGVISVKNGQIIYRYLQDGTTIAGEERGFDAYTGKIIGFQRDYTTDNYIDVELNEEVEDVTAFNDKYIYVDNGSKIINGAYRIIDAEEIDGGVRLNLGEVSLISGYADRYNFALGYKYNIAKGQTFRIPMNFVDDKKPVFTPVPDSLSASVDSMFTQKVEATSELGEVTYTDIRLPRGASFDAETSTFSWKPTRTQIGDHVITIEAEAGGVTERQTFVLTVYGSTTGGITGGSSSGSDSGSSGGGGGGGGGAILPEEPDEPIVDPDEPVVDPDEPIVDPDEPVSPGVDGFVDLGNHAWAEESINSLAEEGIIKGTSETTYSPAANITRADFAILLVRAFKLESENTENFADVDPSDYFAGELAIARNTGIVNGIGDNKYAPRRTITRQDMMVIVYRALKTLGVKGLVAPEMVDETALSKTYTDYSLVADYAKEAVSVLSHMQLVNGKNGRIAPNDYTTRAEVAVLIKRILDFVASK